jgi:D-alanyl-D-alanine carboxypeptidase/D-alanyl-D-alanine-endopeptidase (penicillin-binding protein 4)
MFSKKSIFFGLLTSILLGLMVCTPQKSEEKPKEIIKVSISEFNQFIKDLPKQTPLKSANVGFILMDESGNTISELQSGNSLAPASVMKVITTASALEILGTDFQFETQLAYTGKIENGVLKGNLVIVGGGDPTLGSKNVLALLSKWAGIVKQAGINKIEGNIVGDGSIFDSQLIPNTWVWEDMGNYYGSGACGLNINENLYKLYFKPNSVGKLATVLRTEPKIPEITFSNEMKTGSASSGDQGYIFGAPFTYNRTLRGSIPAGRTEFAIKGALPNPPLQCATWLKKALEKIGISSLNAEASFVKSTQKRTLIHTEKSKTLAEIVKRTNTKSINIYAEAMLKMIGVKQKEKGSSASGAEAVKEYWETKGIDANGFFMEDGSGLSRFNGITAKQCVTILQSISKEPFFAQFYQSLAVSGQSGTLKRVCRNSVATGKIHAKSGSMKRVRCYAGFVENQAGKKYTFAILINNYSGKYSSLTPTVEKLMEKMVRLEVGK